MAERNLTGQLRQSIVVYAAVGMLAIGVIISIASMVPLYRYLKQDAQENLLLAVQTKSQAVEEYLWRVRDIAEQIASRSKAREALENYNQGEVKKPELAQFSTPLLADALNQSPEIVGITRLDRAGNPVVEVGMPIARHLWQVPPGEGTNAIVSQPIRLKEQFYIVAGAPIINKQSQRVGTDIVLFDIARLVEILQEFTEYEKNGNLLLAAQQNNRIEQLFPFDSEQPGVPWQDNVLAATLREAIGEEKGLMMTKNAAGSAEAIAYDWLAKNQWVLLAKIPPEQLYAPLRQQITILAAMMVVFLILATGGMVLLLRPLTGKVLLHTDELERLLEEKTAHLQAELQQRRRTERLLAAHARESAVVAGLGQWALAGMDLSSLIEEAARQVTQTLEVDLGLIWEWVENENILRLRGTAGGWEAELKKAIGNGVRDTQEYYTVVTNEPVRVEDLGEEMRFSPWELLVRCGVVSGMSVLVPGPACPFGVLSAYSLEKRQFSNDDLYFLQAIANVLATAIERQQQEKALRESEERYALAVAGANDGLWDWNLNRDRLYFSVRWKSLLGYEDEEIGDRPGEWFERVHPEDLDSVKAAIADHLAGVTPHFKSEHRMLDANGEYRWMLSRGLAVRDSEGKPYRMAGSQTDISDRKATEKLNLRLAAFPKYNPNPVLACDPNGEIIYVNPATERVLEQLRIGLATGFLPVNHREIVANCLTQGQRGWQVERQIHDRVYSWLYYPIASLQVVHMHVMDISDRASAEEKLRHEALHDNLTGLPNRAFFLNRLGAALERAQQDSDCWFAVVFLDLDRFKVVNDSLGHTIGDRLLIAFSRRLQECVNRRDVVARFGGDEFTLLVENLHHIDDAIAICDRIHQALALPFNVSGYEVFTTASIGIAPSWMGYDRPEDLLRDADIAMYRAKARGKARHEVFDRRMLDGAVALLTLENDLRRAILKDVEPRNNGHLPSAIAPPTSRVRVSYGNPTNGKGCLPSSLDSSEFLVYYQPIVSLETGLLSGFEALVRWQHPERGLISPVEFIPVAEETGLILPLGEWVLREACLQMQQWQGLYPNSQPLSISVNLSGQQLSQLDLIARIDRILAETHLPPSHLKLEITESVLMENAASAAQLLEQLRSRNIHLCIDDFGTGYSSLSHLAQFPINTLKIDKSFVMGMYGDNENAEIVRAIAMLAHNLGMYVTAEGVEKEEHLVNLWALRCDFGQGYFFSKPLPKDAAEALLKKCPRW